jgi:hypothetical protein
MAATSAVNAGRTTASGLTGPAVSASSWVSSSFTPTPTSTLAAPTISTNRSATVGSDPPNGPGEVVAMAAGADDDRSIVPLPLDVTTTG